jgi:ABC-type multidrug transport system fused ATPase/permease subunit
LYSAIMFLCAQACITYLGNRTWREGKDYYSDFQGYRRMKVCLPVVDPKEEYHQLFFLFKWAYENASSDKLGILRQIVAPQLVGTDQDNFSILAKRAGSSLEEAKNNFDQYLHKRVDDYFGKRLQVIEFLQKFSDDTGASVTKLADDLVADLYKTVGVILGVVLAALVNPKITFPVIYWTSLLYMIYILFITFHLLTSAYIRYAGKVSDHQFNIQKMSSVLSDTEIEQVQGAPFMRAKRLFQIYFGLTEFAYLLLGGLAYLIMKSVLPYI